MQTRLAPAPQASAARSISLESVLITDELRRRGVRAPNTSGENAAFFALSSQALEGPQALLQCLMDLAVVLCCAGTAGVSLLEESAEEGEIFRWVCLSGVLAENLGGTTPREFSPCGVCLDQDRAVLFSHPERRYTYFQDVGVPFVEALVLPFGSPRRGTIWIIAHDTSRRFDLEDVRIMSVLAAFTGNVYRLQEGMMNTAEVRQEHAYSA